MSLTVADVLGYTVGQQVATVNINGGTINDALNGNQGFTTNFIFNAGTMSSTGGGAYHFTAGLLPAATLGRVNRRRRAGSL